MKWPLVRRSTYDKAQAQHVVAMQQALSEAQQAIVEAQHTLVEAQQKASMDLAQATASYQVHAQSLENIIQSREASRVEALLNVLTEKVHTSDNLVKLHDWRIAGRTEAHGQVLVKYECSCGCSILAPERYFLVGA